MLQHVGVAASFGVGLAEELLEAPRPHVTSLDGIRGSTGSSSSAGRSAAYEPAAGRWTPEMTMDWTPVEPTLVAEVGCDQLDRDRFRHPARFRRWRLDRQPRSCTFEQFAEAAARPEQLLAAA